MADKIKRNNVFNAARLSVAPMMDWTDRHCRYFHRLMTRRTLLFTEMVTAPAVIHGDRDRLLGFDPAEHPVVLQLGGSDPAQLAEATRIAADYGYDGVDLNVGCPSDRVRAGTFGAVLMERPEQVAACARSMLGASDLPVSVKCRIGVDDQDPETILPAFLETVSEAGINQFTIHARKAWLQGLSPRDNRDVPPLNHDLVHRMNARFEGLRISINGGIVSLDAALEHLGRGLDGVMIGRAAYHDPAAILLNADQRIFGDPTPPRSATQVVEDMLPYIERHLGAGGRLHQITRHMLGLFSGRPGARHWRRVLSEQGTRPGAGPALVQEAMRELS